MKKLTVTQINNVTKDSNIKQVSEALDKISKQQVDIANWPEFSYKPGVSFAIAHGNNCVVLKYYVKEKDIQAHYNKINEHVYKDSCVEFFISFDESGYYNFEFNCIGNCLVAYGPNKTSREFLPVDLLKKIKYHAVIKKTSEQENAEWELTLLIPVEVFAHHSVALLKGQLCRANFYKCGDELPVPHYLSWAEIKTTAPDFHQPSYFGLLEFA